MFLKAGESADKKVNLGGERNFGPGYDEGMRVAVVGRGTDLFKKERV